MNDMTASLILHSDESPARIPALTTYRPAGALPLSPWRIWCRRLNLLPLVVVLVLAAAAGVWICGGVVP